MALYEWCINNNRQDLLDQWNYDKNNDLTPKNVTIGTNQKVWWHLPYNDPKTGKYFDFEWEATIANRVKGKGCPYLTGRAVWAGFNDLATTRPDLAAQWHPTKNGNLTPENVTAGSNKVVWWYLPYDDPKTGKHFDFEWESTVNNRNRGNGCPYLSKYSPKIYVGFNDLATTRPDLAAQWHPTKNGDLTPEEVTTNANQKVWWLYPYDDPKTGKHFDFEWEAEVYNRNNDRNCPFLTGKAVWAGFNDLATTRPDLAAEWHPTKNGNLTPEDVTENSHQKAWWLYPYDDPETGKHFDFEWEATIGNRSESNGCPFLSNQRIWAGFNDLATKRPDLAAQWHPTKNGNLTPKDVTKNSKEKVWWLFPYDDPETGKHFDFEWQSTVGTRYKGDGCPFLSGQRIWAGFNDLTTTRPDLAAQWHPTKNGNLTPYDVTSGIDKKVWWFYPYDDPETGKHFDFEWEARINTRNRGDRCPFLSGQRIWVGFNDLATTRPDLAAQWHPTKNGDLTPYDVTSGIDKKVWWLLPYDDPETGNHFDFEWEARIVDRSRGCGCPYLSGSSVEKFIYSILLQNNINFTTEKTFKETGKCRFDIFIPKYNIIIEPDGIQHFKNSFSLPVYNWEENIKRDSLKNQFCLDNNVKILRIPYIYDIKKDKEKIKKLITDFIKTRKVPENILEFYKQFKFHNYYQIATELNEK